MGVKLGIACGKLREQARDVGLVHARVLQQAEDSIRMPDMEAGQRGPGVRGEWMEDGDVKRAIREMSGGHAQVQSKWIERQAQVLDAQLGRISHQDAEYGRMQVQVQVAVDVVERKASGAEL